MEYKIIFIDEEQDQLDKLCRSFHRHLSPNEAEVIPLLPEQTLEDMLKVIADHQPDAVITDFLLNEKKNYISHAVEYTGSELVKIIDEQKEGFPCFVTSSHDQQATDNTYDVNKVYPKQMHLKTGSESSSSTRDVLHFSQRVIIQIKKYKKRILECQERFEYLCIQRTKGYPLTAIEEDELVKLDCFLERAFDKPSAIPEELKKSSNSEQLRTLIENVQELMSEIKNARKS